MVVEIEAFLKIGVDNILNVRGIAINKVGIYLIFKMNVREANMMFVS